MHTFTFRCLSALGLLSTVLGNSFPGSNPGPETRTLDQIYAAAQLESGELTVAWGGDGEYLPFSTHHEFIPRLMLQQKTTKEMTYGLPGRKRSQKLP